MTTEEFSENGRVCTWYRCYEASLNNLKPCIGNIQTKTICLVLNKWSKDWIGISWENVTCKLDPLGTQILVRVLCITSPKYFSNLN